MSGIDIFPTGTGSPPPPSAPSQSVGATIFPSPTAPYRDRGPGASTNGVYYLVFLGVLLALILLAAALTLRSYRMRARYRTQTQLAIARGDAPTGWWGDDMWGVPWAGPARPPRRERRWMPIPVLFDAVPVPAPEPKFVSEKGKAVETDLWDDIQPLTIHSLLPPDPEPEPEPQPAPDSVRLRPPGAGFTNFRRRMGLDAALPDPPPPTPRAPEMSRPLADAEPLRVAVIVQMPTEWECDASSALSDDDEIGWRPGMEIGVWEGVVEGSGGVSSGVDTSEIEPTHTFSQEFAPPPGPPPLSVHPNPYVPYQRRTLSVDTSDAGSGSTLWTPAKPGFSPAKPSFSPSKPGFSSTQLEATPEVPSTSTSAATSRPPPPPSSG
ncbi:hypothetical protein CC85DRAFT_286562 [Cutaneotrichosporon oleaginosum]|uniref:Uncharacterized protein n=1 Tax=Cutaneotrichosporon oleaginosum TaxID=879819 RepID=A0A0J0XJU1_9TREE|nr:uncharacterized protein CC85DRAFT_286562 [Cutaneotrichosporon oleaginosum]KLT41385.1 hypothetical protein CC85DRAFT_286562 [Cutaneotrichosporon oleaginosum]TXT06327.1 hypothetical protein COLE_05658 [Cutaneotrichosporon oleaginosum]